MKKLGDLMMILDLHREGLKLAWRSRGTSIARMPVSDRTVFRPYRRLHILLCRSS